MTDYNALLNKLCNREMQFIVIKKGEFLQFREHLLKHEHYKNFRGEAKQGGDVVYSYIENPRV